MATGELNGNGRTERDEYYATLLDEQEESGLSVAAFADEVGVSAATLYSWRRRLGWAGTRTGGAALLEVCVRDDEGVGCGSVRMSVDVGSGMRIELDADFDESVLERLLGVLARC